MYYKCFSKSVRGGHVVHEECGEITTLFVFIIHSQLLLALGLMSNNSYLLGIKNFGMGK